MASIWVESLARSFEQALDLLAAAVRDCTEDLWETPMWQVPAPDGNHKFLGSDWKVVADPPQRAALVHRWVQRRSTPWSVVWHALEGLDYDLNGDVFRGRLRTDAAGAYRIETTTPGRYLNGGVYRPAHIHVKVHANGRPSLTTQLYFPGDPYADADPWFRESLVIRYAPFGCSYPIPNAPQRASFDFIV